MNMIYYPVILFVLGLVLFFVGALKDFPNMAGSSVIVMISAVVWWLMLIFSPTVIYRQKLVFEKDYSYMLYDGSVFYVFKEDITPLRVSDYKTVSAPDKAVLTKIVEQDRVGNKYFSVKIKPAP